MNAGNGPGEIPLLIQSLAAIADDHQISTWISSRRKA